MGSSFDKALDAGFGLPGLIIAMLLVALGGGGFKMLMVPFIGKKSVSCAAITPILRDFNPWCSTNVSLADQYIPDNSTGTKVTTLKSGERVLADRSLTLQYIYNMYYWYVISSFCQMFS